ncbi:LOW QUALITY PROTEIN: peptide synthetase [Colletotrichum tofieldiae]|nr:LOW QUALITY PROTEIN: peptide synthetase [Colletotrichum tofieldiae]
MVSYASHIIEPWRVKGIIGHFGHVLQQLADAAATRKTLSDVSLMSPGDMDKIWSWNRGLPSTIDRCIHDLIGETSQRHPGAQAICSWDGNLTYKELDSLSSSLSLRLVRLGVGPEVLVPLYFDKSLWTVVAMLAILKAGGVFVPLNPDAHDRRDHILAQTEAKVILVSERYAGLGFAKDLIVLPVGPNSRLADLEEDSERHITECASPSSAAYMIFTSGSTGEPKGILLDHRAVSTSCYHHGTRIGYGMTSRVLQFASYVFDVSLQEILTTLVFGGCVCVPSEADRLNDVARCISSMSVNMAFLTPTVARVIKPACVPSLKTIMLGGEKATRQDFARWADQANVGLNGYGPAECAICCCVNEIDWEDLRPHCIGTAVGSASWVTAPGNANQLVPIGVIGELLVEGPILARGYFKNPELTAATFIEPPDWLREGSVTHPGRTGRLYKTGDLVRYDESGKLMYIGRKDTQIKIRGQRMELEEVELHLRRSLNVFGSEVAVEAIIPYDADASNAVLTAFIALNEASVEPNGDLGAHTNGGSASHSNGFNHGSKTCGVSTLNGQIDETSLHALTKLMNIPSSADLELKQHIPAYMVPTTYVAVPMDYQRTRKLDRKKLRAIGASFSVRDIAAFAGADKDPKRAPTNDSETTLQHLWRRCLDFNGVISE